MHETFNLNKPRDKAHIYAAFVSWFISLFNYAEAAIKSVTYLLKSSFCSILLK